MLSNNVLSEPMETKGGTIEKYDISQLSESDLSLFHDIEKDTWGHFLSEYVKCTGTCGYTSSKQDVYGSKDEEYHKKTIRELEKKFGNEICCTKCGGETEFVWGEEYKNGMKERLTQSVDSYMAVYKNKVGEICGHIFGYVDTLKNIGDREFQYKFTPELLESLSDLHDKLFITITSTCIQQKDQDVSVVFDMLKYYFYHCVDDKYLNISGVSDGVVGTPTFNIYTRSGAQPFGLPERGKQFLLSPDKEAGSDVFIHPNVVNDYRSFYNLKLRGFLKTTKNKQVNYWNDGPFAE